MKPTLSLSLLAALLGGCDLPGNYGPDTSYPDPPTVIYRVTATPDTVAPGEWVRLKCVVRDSLDPTITYLWDNATIPGLQDLPRKAEILVQAPYNSPVPYQEFSVSVGRNGSSGIGVAKGYTAFIIR
ncbi:MAG: hypothetical protein LCH53_10715 [Bacteroidetes bacterium]|nr:hypothetical protein [Bacteroidota bacterium]